MFVGVLVNAQGVSFDHIDLSLVGNLYLPIPYGQVSIPIPLVGDVAIMIRLMVQLGKN